MLQNPPEFCYVLIVLVTNWKVGQCNMAKKYYLVFVSKKYDVIIENLFSSDDIFSFISLLPIRRKGKDNGLES